jgi:hypothetical protein
MVCSEPHSVNKIPNQPNLEFLHLPIMIGTDLSRGDEFSNYAIHTQLTDEVDFTSESLSISTMNTTCIRLDTPPL